MQMDRQIMGYSPVLTTTGIIQSSYTASVRKSQQCPNGLMRKRERYRQRETDRDRQTERNRQRQTEEEDEDEDEDEEGV